MEHLVSGFIRELTGQLKALANSTLFWKTPIFLKYSGACGSSSYYNKRNKILKRVSS